jgi:hypothetical protein
MRQIRQSSGPLYNITAADFAVPLAVVLTLDRPYQEGSGLADYLMYQAYYPPTDPLTNAPTADFEKWISIYDPINGYPLKLNMTQQYLNTVDPLRGDMGQPYFVANYMDKNIAGTNDPVPYFELWPHATDGVSRKCFYKKGKLDWTSASDALPSELPVELLETRARYRAYEWAESQKGVHLELSKTNWMSMRQELMDPRDRSSYPFLLAVAKAQDENRMPINFVLSSVANARFPIDSDFLQAHEWSWDYPGETP